MLTPIAWKNRITLSSSLAPAAGRKRTRPPRIPRSLLNTSLSAQRWESSNSLPNGLPARSCRNLRSPQTIAQWNSAAQPKGPRHFFMHRAENLLVETRYRAHQRRADLPHRFPHPVGVRQEDVLRAGMHHKAPGTLEHVRQRQETERHIFFADRQPFIMQVSCAARLR